MKDHRPSLPTASQVPLETGARETTQHDTTRLALPSCSSFAAFPCSRLHLGPTTTGWLSERVAWARPESCNQTYSQGWAGVLVKRELCREGSFAGTGAGAASVASAGVVSVRFPLRRSRSSRSRVCALVHDPRLLTRTLPGCQAARLPGSFRCLWHCSTLVPSTAPSTGSPAVTLTPLRPPPTRPNQARHFIKPRPLISPIRGPPPTSPCPCPCPWSPTPTHRLNLFQLRRFPGFDW